MLSELLQAVGLNKYEAEAYAALLRHGPLTGYELGKRSAVPLSRSYEVLERLAGKGLALVQPGDPPRYIAEAPEQLLARLRSESSTRLDALGQALAELAQPRRHDGFWVARGRGPIVAQARALIDGATRSIAVSLDPAHAQELDGPLARARGAGRRVERARAAGAPGSSEAIALLVDGREALVGTLAPADGCQAVRSANPAFVAAIGRSFAPTPLAMPVLGGQGTEQAGEARPLSWLDWEDHKQRSLLAPRPDDRGAGSAI
jgi:sugar-specific transcriptional regulator TrmB